MKATHYHFSPSAYVYVRPALRDKRTRHLRSLGHIPEVSGEPSGRGHSFRHLWKRDLRHICRYREPDCSE